MNLETVQIAFNSSIGLRSADGGRESGAESGEKRLAERSRSETPPAVHRRKHAVHAVQ
jgi:hypothetical protein